MPATLARFDFKEWIRRFGAALEDTAARARHMRVPFGIYGQVATDAREMHRRHQELGALARTDPYASKLFDESHLWLDTLPDGLQGYPAGAPGDRTGLVQRLARGLPPQASA